VMILHLAQARCFIAANLNHSVRSASSLASSLHLAQARCFIAANLNGIDSHNARKFLHLAQARCFIAATRSRD
jgi:hypothetical protein